MNEIVNKFLLAGENVMPEMHSDLLTVLANHLLKTKKEYKNSGDARYIYQNELDKACFEHNIAYVDFTDLPRITDSDEMLRIKAFNIDKSLVYDGYQRSLALIVYTFSKKGLQVVLLNVKLCQTKN